MINIGPLLACPRCGGALADEGRRWICTNHGAVITRRDDDILDALGREGRSEHSRFLDQYNSIRARENRSASVELPFVSPGHPFEAEWRHRSASMRRLLDELLARQLLPGGIILDAGAGVCWLSRRLVMAGANVVALDVNDDRGDGLVGGAVMLRGGIAFHRVLGDMERLPFVAHSFDVVVFNGAFHYARNRIDTLAGALRVLRPGGLVCIMDSPVYRWERSGRKMIDARGPGRSGFLTHAELSGLARSLNLEINVLAGPISIGDRLKRFARTLRLGREPASMPFIVYRERVDV